MATSSPAIAVDTHDDYPSRVFDTPQLLPRRDPVLYSEPAAGDQLPLSAQQLDSYEREGFLLLENLFDEQEVAVLRNELEYQKEEAAKGGSAKVITEPGSNAVRSIFEAHTLGRIFPAVASDQRILSIVEYLLASQVYVHQSRVNLKPGFRGKEFYWHSDFETWHVEDGMPRMRAISCSISLTDNYQQNGPLLLIPGSHKTFVSCVGKTPSKHYEQSLRKQEYGVPDDESLKKLVDDSKIVAATGKAGSVVLFECNVMHGSNSNITPYPRSNIFTVYNSVENVLQDPFGGLEPRPEHIANRTDCNALQKRFVDYRALAGC
ncbi:MAG: ectoine hydroxylase [Bdellovibrionales bacterium]|nr:ectoine hydroxylase [Bdellovibrionales bacterium]